MLTPQEVTNSVFEKALLGGYDTASVDKFMAQLTQDYSALYRENGILKAKMKVLVDKVEDYRSTEDSMRMALLQEPEPAAPAEPTPEEVPPTQEEPPKEGVSQDTVENIAEIINKAFSSLEEKEKSAEEEPYREFTSSTIPKIDYDNLQFGENYDPKNKK